MEFKIGDAVLVNTPDPSRRYYGVISMVLDLDEGAYLVENGKGSTQEVHALNLNILPDENGRHKKLKMEFSLERNFKEIVKSIEEGDYLLTSQGMTHDYDGNDNEHMININIVLKEANL